MGPEGPLCTAGLPSQDGSGFRAYVQPANNKRKASEVGNLASAPAAKQANHPMARAGALAATTKVSPSDSLWSLLLQMEARMKLSLSSIL